MKIIVPVLAVLIWAGGCCNCTGNKLDISVKVIEMNAWLNLMPGMDPGSFHIAGKLEIKNNEAEAIIPLLHKITVLQKEKIIYELTPYFEPDLKTESNDITSEDVKNFSMGSEGTLPIKNEFDKESEINLLLEFQWKDKSYFYTVENIKIEKAY